MIAVMVAACVILAGAETPQRQDTRANLAAALHYLLGTVTHGARRTATKSRAVQCLVASEPSSVKRRDETLPFESVRCRSSKIFKRAAELRVQYGDDSFTRIFSLERVLTITNVCKEK